MVAGGGGPDFCPKSSGWAWYAAIFIFIIAIIPRSIAQMALVVEAARNRYKKPADATEDEARRKEALNHQAALSCMVEHKYLYYEINPTEFSQSDPRFLRILKCISTFNLAF